MASQASVRDSVIYLAVAAGIAGTPLLLFHNHPVAFAYLVAEDFHGEYATAAAFGAASLLFLADAWRAPARSRRAISAAIALAALLIAGEEVSWGHRLWYGMLDFA